MSWTDAKPKLVALGFDLQYNAVADAFPDTFKVSATDPAGGTSVRRRGCPASVNCIGVRPACRLTDVHRAIICR